MGIDLQARNMWSLSRLWQADRFGNVDKLKCMCTDTLQREFKVRTRNPPPSTRNPKPETRNQKPETCNLKPEIRNPKPETRNPKPET